MPERILLIGAAGKTGAAYAKLLQAHGHHLLWYDKNPQAKPEGLHAGQLTYVESQTLEFARLRGSFDRLTLTPGVPLRHPFILEARAAGIPVITEVAYCAPYLTGYKIIGITGTDGKSTTTAIIAQILRALGKPAFECGNFGTPLSEIVLNPEHYANGTLSCELSSYQLEEPGKLNLDAAIFLNLAPDHLNRYAGIEEYGLAKWNIAGLLRAGQPIVVAQNLLPENTTYWKNGHPLAAGKPRFISVDSQLLRAANFAVQDGFLVSERASVRYDLRDCALAGAHNLSNLLFALEALHAVYPELLAQDLTPALRAIQPLPHRFEKIPQFAMPHVTFINDSKATTTQAAMTALKNAADPVFIFLGGQGKGETYGELGKALKAKSARALIYGECREDMARDFRLAGFQDFTLHENLFKAFHTAKRMVGQQKLASATLLLSPAVTSWDQFSSFEARGDYFRELVQSL
ncbi:MAG TPA: UDP-N-acetylmuramoyl-L-alanine--D-glutamate ligase [Turneriella sp.]|nr:UDP-N-acetylmuramoyl-L-alanine--D-glutamate ligase [Turneriella sp.]